MSFMDEGDWSISLIGYAGNNSHVVVRISFIST